MHRVIGTVLGATAGLAAWYIGNGNGTGNAYGFCAVAAVLFPLLYCVRLYYPARERLDDPPFGSVADLLVRSGACSYRNCHLVCCSPSQISKGVS